MNANNTLLPGMNVLNFDRIKDPVNLIRYLLHGYYASIKTKNIPVANNLLMLAAIIARAKSFRIIIADDDDDDRDLFKEAIDEMGAEALVSTACDGEELMKLLSKTEGTPPDIIFLDLNMPRMNGHQCLAEIRKNSKMSSIPVVIYSTSSSREQIEATYKAGATLYISKPDSFNDLKKIIKKIFDIDWKSYLPQPKKDKYVLRIK